jgi:hypothetical protein
MLAVYNIETNLLAQHLFVADSIVVVVARRSRVKVPEHVEQSGVVHRVHHVGCVRT